MKKIFLIINIILLVYCSNRKLNREIETTIIKVKIKEIIKEVGKKGTLVLYTNFIYIGIGLLKKETKNQVKLQKEFFDIYSIDHNYYNRKIIELNEDNFSNDKNYLRLQNLDDEINYISYLINITDEKLLEYENNNKNI